MIYDPHTAYNPNFREEDWKAYQVYPKAIELAKRIQELHKNGLVARISHNVLCNLNFDIVSRVDYSAITLQMSYSPHWAALAISMMTHSCFEPNREEKVTRFYKSLSPNPIMYPPNITFVEDEWGREHAVL